MNIRSILIALVLVLLTLFSLLNWTLIVTPADLSLGFTTVHAPLGLILLGAIVLVCALFLLYIVIQQAGVIMDARRMGKEMSANRELADKAEASRFTELRGFLDGELRKLEAQFAAGTRELASRLDRLDRQVGHRDPQG